MLNRYFRHFCAVFLVVTMAGFAPAFGSDYLVNPGDQLMVNVWNEEALSGLVLVRPDGFISMPMAGEIDTRDNSLSQVSEKISDALSRFMKDAPQVVVSLVESPGYKIYVLGKVQRPGEYRISSQTDIMQALALAGGLNTFAAGDDIVVLRRNEDGSQVALPFEYDEVESGKNLETNIVLQSRDVVVVP